MHRIEITEREFDSIYIAIRELAYCEGYLDQYWQWGKRPVRLKIPGILTS